MGEIRDYPSQLSNPASRKFETFSYLPELDETRIRNQLKYIVNKGWHPAIEHTEPEHALQHYWYMWKLPLFNETDVEQILSEAQACHKAYPNHHVRLIGYDSYTQTQGTAMVIFRGPITG